MQISIRRRSGRTVAQLRGELDALSSEGVVEQVTAAVGSEPVQVVLDLGGLRFIDSAGLDAIVRLSKRLALQGGKLALSSPSPFSRSVIERIGLDRVVPIIELDEASECSARPSTSPTSQI